MMNQHIDVKKAFAGFHLTNKASIREVYTIIYQVYHIEMLIITYTHS